LKNERIAVLLFPLYEFAGEPFRLRRLNLTLWTWQLILT